MISDETVRCVGAQCWVSQWCARSRYPPVGRSGTVQNDYSLKQLPNQDCVYFIPFPGKIPVLQE